MCYCVVGGEPTLVGQTVEEETTVLSSIVFTDEKQLFARQNFAFCRSGAINIMHCIAHPVYMYYTLLTDWSPVPGFFSAML